MKVHFLGTSGSTFDRGNMPPSILVDEDIVLDCPAPCPYRVSSSLEPNRLSYYLSHVHLDHSLGILDLAWHLWITRSGPVRVHIPAGSVDQLRKLVAPLHPRWREIWDRLELIEVRPGDRVGDVYVVPASHGIPAVGYVVERRGRRLCYSGDTAPMAEHVEAFKGCDLLVYESTYPPGWEEAAVRDGHSTPLQAAEIALRSGSSMLALIHIPTARLGPGIVEEYLRAARGIFPETYAPRPGEIIEL